MNKYFANLDVLRAMLAIIVALGHFFLWNKVYDVIPKSFFMAVDVFFVLSGFVLTQKTLSVSIADVRNYTKDYLFKRFFRLWPLYILLFFVCTILQLIEFGKDIDSFKYFLISFFLLQAMGFGTSAQHLFADTVVGISWSVSVEFWVGLFFFTMVFILRNPTKLLWLACTVIALVSSLIIIFFSPNHMDVHLQRVGIVTFASIRCVCGFALGCLSFFLFQYLNRISFQRFFSEIIEVAAIIASVLVFYVDLKYQFLAPYIFAVLIAIVSTERGVISRFLSHQVFSWLRPISYSVYLVHPFYILFYRKADIPFTLQSSAIYIALVVLSSIMLYKYIEKPAIDLGKRLMSKDKTA